MSRSIRLPHQSLGRRRPRVEILEPRRVLSFTMVEIGPPPAALPPLPPAGLTSPPVGISVDLPPAPPIMTLPGGVTVDPPTALPPALPVEGPGASGGVSVDPPPAPPTITPPDGVMVDPPA